VFDADQLLILNILVCDALSDGLASIVLGHACNFLLLLSVKSKQVDQLELGFEYAAMGLHCPTETITCTYTYPLLT
jgi:hypothetical protein